jgi:flavin prenyltransferase
VPAFYTRPKTIEDLILHTVGRVLDHFGLAPEELSRWGEAGR